MAIWHNILNHIQTSAAQKAHSISHRLFKQKNVSAKDIDTLINLEHDSIEVFQQVLHEHQHASYSIRRESILDLLANHPSPSTKNYITLLASFIDDPSAHIRHQSISLLATYHTESEPLVSAILIKALHSPHSQTRMHTIKTLSLINHPKFTKALFITLADKNNLVRETAASAITALNDPSIIKKLIRMMQDDKPHVRAQALRILNQINNKKYSDLKSQLQNSEWMSSNPILSQLLGWNEMHGDSMERNSSSEISPNREADRRSRVLQLALNISALNDSHYEVQFEAVQGLAVAQLNTAIMPLLTRFHTANQELQYHISTACKCIGIKRVATYLSHQDHHIRSTVAKILTEHGDIHFLSMLNDAWQHEKHSDTRMHMIIAIGSIAARVNQDTPDNMIKTLIQAAGHKDKTSAYHAKKALEIIQHPLAEQFIQAPLQSSKIAIKCPNCLERLSLKPPITHKTWLCHVCHLHFTIETDSHGQITVSPTMKYKKTSKVRNVDSIPWYQVLNIQASADNITIKRAFRTLLKQYHPDRVATLGDEFKQLSEEKTIQLTEALRTGLAVSKKTE